MGVEREEMATPLDREQMNAEHGLKDPEVRVGLKYDSDKVRLDLVPPSLMWAVGKVLTFGANKYGDRNWEAGISYHRVWGALLRHLLAWWACEKFDEESGKPHLYHAACCLSFLIHYEEYPDKYQGPFDDRPDYEEKIVWENKSIPSSQGTQAKSHASLTPSI